jgi:PAN domain
MWATLTIVAVWTAVRATVRAIWTVVSRYARCMLAAFDNDAAWVYAALCVAACLACVVADGAWARRHMATPAPAPAPGSPDTIVEGFVVPWSGDMYDGATGLEPADVELREGGGPESSPALFAAFGDSRWTPRTGAALVGLEDRIRETRTLGGSGECRDECDRNPECAAATYNRSTSSCRMYSAVGDTADSPTSVTFSRRDRPVFRSLPRTGLQTSEPVIGSTTARDASACRRACADDQECNAATYDRASRRCTRLRSVRAVVAPARSTTHAFVKAV